MKKYRGGHFSASNFSQRLFVCLCGVFVFSFISISGSMNPSCWGYIWTDYDGKNYDSNDYNPGPSSSSSDSGSSGWTRQDQLQYEAEQREQRAAWDAQQAQMREGANLNNEAIRFDNAGDFDAAIASYQKALQYLPGDQRILENLKITTGKKSNADGNRYFEQGDYEKAVAAYEQAAQALQGNEVVRDNLAKAQEQWQNAQESRRKAAEAKVQMDAAGTRIKSMVDSFGKELKPVSAPAAAGGLEFKKSGGNTDRGFFGWLGGRKDPDAGLHPLAFKHMNPEKPPIIDMGGGPPPQGGSKTAEGQLKSTELHGREAKAVPFDDTASDRARLGFDTAGVAGDGLATSPVVNVPEAKVGWTMIPEDKRTPEIDKLDVQRSDARNERLQIEKKLSEMQNKPGVDPMEIVRMREKADTLKNKENFLDFSIREELGKAPDVKRDGKKEEKK